MKRRLTAASLMAACALAATPSASADAPRAETLTANLPRITQLDARYAARLVFGNLAGGLNERLVIAPCKATGQRARVCAVRLGRDRYTVKSFYSDATKNITAAVQRR